MQYSPPTREGLRLLKETLKYNNAQMADMFGIASGRQFHKYLSDEDPRGMSLHVLIFGMMQLHLLQGPIKDIEQLYALGRELGATIAPDSDGDSQD